MMKQECTKCGYIWDSHLLSPKQCPKCKRYDWNKIISGDFTEPKSKFEELELKVKMMAEQIKELNKIVNEK